MIFRRILLALGIVAAAFTLDGTAFAFAGVTPFTTQAFQDAEKGGKPILVEIHASWCPTCRAQKEILSNLLPGPKFKDMVVLRVDFDDQKPIVRQFGARRQSTLIVYKGNQELGRSVGDTDPASIATLLGKAL